MTQDREAYHNLREAYINEVKEKHPEATNLELAKSWFNSSNRAEFLAYKNGDMFEAALEGIIESDPNINLTEENGELYVVNNS